MTPKPILLALDGDDAVLKTIARVAAPHYQCMATCDPRKFLAWMENTPGLAVALTEHVLQTSSGVALLQTARTLRPTARRVLLTTYHDLASIVDGLHSGAIEHLVQKPFTHADLLNAILPEGYAGNAAQRASA